MKAFILSCIAAACVIIFVFTNSFIIYNRTSYLTDKIETIPSSSEHGNEYKQTFEEYQKMQMYFSITVGHSDLTVIEDSFAELLGAVEAEDEESLKIAKSRLIQALHHLKRLSGVNFDSIF